MKLNEIFEIPEGLLDVSARVLHQIMPEPALLHLPGQREGAVFVSILLHGNEDTGLKAVQQVLRHYQGKVLPRPLSIFFGNVSAASQGLRRLDGQPDYNRVWPGTLMPDVPEANLAAQVVASMQKRGVFASIDIHNNTGLNPLYGCVTRLDPKSLHLARLFSRTVVWFTQPVGVAAGAMAALGPSVTVECGKPGVPANERHAAELIEAVLHLSAFPEQAPAPEDLDVYHTVVILKVPEVVTMSFDGSESDLRFVPSLDHLNFRELTEGAVLAETGLSRPLLAVDEEQGLDRFSEFLDVQHGRLVLRRSAMPAMLTLDERVVRQDCLCYLMERVELPA